MLRKLFGWLASSPLRAPTESVDALLVNTQAMQTSAEKLPASPQKDAILHQVELQRAAILHFRKATAV